MIKMNIESSDLKKIDIYGRLHTCPCYICKNSTYKKSLIKCNLTNQIKSLDTKDCEDFELNPLIIQEPHLICKLCIHCAWRYNDAFGEYYPYCENKTIYALGSSYNPQIGINCPCENFKLEDDRDEIFRN